MVIHLCETRVHVLSIDLNVKTFCYICCRRKAFRPYANACDFYNYTRTWISLDISRTHTASRLCASMNGLSIRVWSWIFSHTECMHAVFRPCVSLDALLGGHFSWTFCRICRKQTDLLCVYKRELLMSLVEWILCHKPCKKYLICFWFG